jgi:hypothetical protein
MSQEGTPVFQPCSEREQLIKKAASARREYDELKRALGALLIGTEEYHAVNEQARAALREAEVAMSEYLLHVQEHRC